MTDEAEMNDALQEWKSEMQAEHAEAIEIPDPDADHRIEGVTQVNYRITFEYDAEADALERAETEQVDELSDPELLSCACGVRGMTRAEALSHIEAAGE
jgi:CheY-like chemotaxis protein